MQTTRVQCFETKQTKKKRFSIKNNNIKILFKDVDRALSKTSQSKERLLNRGKFFKGTFFSDLHYFQTFY